jgi:mannose-6-phosphate isomerase-like protein (cupin superfamily)
MIGASILGRSKYLTENDLEWKEAATFDRVFSKVLVGKDLSKTFELIIQKIEPGGKVPKHSHQEESLYYFLEGNGKIYLGDSIFDGYPGSGVYILPWEIHGIYNTGKAPIKYLEIKCPNNLKK